MATSSGRGRLLCDGVSAEAVATRARASSLAMTSPRGNAATGTVALQSYPLAIALAALHARLRIAADELLQITLNTSCLPSAKR